MLDEYPVLRAPSQWPEASKRVREDAGKILDRFGESFQQPPKGKGQECSNITLRS